MSGRAYRSSSTVRGELVCRALQRMPPLHFGKAFPCPRRAHRGKSRSDPRLASRTTPVQRANKAVGASKGHCFTKDRLERSAQDQLRSLLVSAVNDDQLLLRASTIEVITSRGMLPPVRLRNPHRLLPARVIAGHRPASRVCRPSVRARVSNWTFCRIFPRRLDATPDFSVIFMWQAFCIDRLRRVYQTYSAKR